MHVLRHGVHPLLLQRAEEKGHHLQVVEEIGMLQRQLSDQLVGHAAHLRLDDARARLLLATVATVAVVALRSRTSATAAAAPTVFATVPSSQPPQQCQPSMSARGPRPSSRNRIAPDLPIPSCHGHLLPSDAAMESNLRSSRCWRSGDAAAAAAILIRSESAAVSGPEPLSDLTRLPVLCLPVRLSFPLLPFFPLPAQIYGLSASNNVQRAILAANENQTPFELKVRRLR